MSWKSSRWLLAVALIMIFFGLGLRTILSDLGYWGIFIPTTPIEKIIAADVDSTSNTPIQTLRFQQNTDIPINQQDVIITFNFKANSLRDFEDIMQTASNDNGMRLEFGKDGLPEIIVGSANNKFISHKINYPVNAENFPITPGEWYSVRIHAWNGHRVSVWLNNISTADIKKSQVSFKLNEIVIANGFDKTRPLDGTVKNFVLTYSKTNLVLALQIRILQFVFAGIGLLLLLIYCVKKSQRKLSKNQKVEWFSFAILVGFLVMMTYHFIVTVYHGNCQNTFIFPGWPHWERFGDWYYMYYASGHLNPYQLIRGMYFPFAYVLFYPLYFIPNVALVLMLAFFTTFTIAFVAYYFRLKSPIKNDTVFISNIKNILMISLLSYPFWFAFERGNIEYIVFIFLGFFLFFFQKKMFYRAGIMLACAGAMKMYPLVLLLLFIADRRYYYAAVSVLITAIITLTSLSVLHGGVFQNIHWLIQAIQTSGQTALSIPRPSFSLDLFTLINSGIQTLHLNVNEVYFSKYYDLSVFTILIFLSWYVVFVEKSLWKKTFLLVSAMLLLPPISCHYKLMHLFLPLALFMNAKAEHNEKSDVLYLIMFIILFIPINYGYSAKHYNDFIAASKISSTLILLIGSISIIIGGLRNKKQQSKL